MPYATELTGFFLGRFRQLDVDEAAFVLLKLQDYPGGSKLTWVTIRHR